MKRILSFIFTIILYNTLSAQTFISGAINSNTTWTQANSPYIITSNTVVFGTNTLTIEPGVVVKFDDNVQLRIQGSLIAEGNINDSIVFTSNSTNPQKGQWNEINLEFEAVCLLNYVKLEYAQKGLRYDFISTSSHFRNSVFQFNQSSIFQGTGNQSYIITLDSLKFIQNDIGIADYAYVNMSYCEFINNQTGALLIKSNVNNCFFTGNTDIGLNGHTSSIQNSLFAFNNIGLEQSFSGAPNASIMTKNTIRNNSIGLKITGNNPAATFSSNIVCNNSTYNVLNTSTYSGQDLSNNCWCTSNLIDIETSIFHGIDDINLGAVTFVPISSNCAVKSTDTIIECDSLTWIDGNTYTKNNNSATFNFTNGAVSGVDSLVTLDLTIKNSSTGIDTRTECDSLTWINGITYTSTSNTATYNTVNVNGCDSIVTLDLTIINSSATIDTRTECDSLTWIDGITYTSNNSTATYNIVNVNGCDSLVTLDLTIINSSATIDTRTECDSLTWIDGITYTSNNSAATYNIVNVNGCDSLITLDLTIINSSTGIDTRTECDSLTWIDGITYTASNNNANFNIVGGANNGCDSLVILDLTINNSSTGIDTRTECDSLTWIDGITYTSNNNTATFNIVSCGSFSIVTLDLTIINSSTGIDTRTECDSLTWIDGITYTSNNNTAAFNIIGGANNGCDSLVTLDLTIINSSTGIDTRIECDSLTWIDGITYTSNNNTAAFNIIGGANTGCDSLVTLDLTINNSSTGIDTRTECDSLTWINGITYTSNNNTATYNIVNVNGCDSLVTLDLTIINSSTGIDTRTECGSLTWIDGITYASNNNTATYNIVNVNGCDSLVILDLTISNLDVNYTFTDNGNGNYSFTNTSVGNFNQFHWAFGDGNISTATNPNHTFSNNGSFVTILSIKDSITGCFDYFIDTITVTGVSSSIQCNSGFVIYPDTTGNVFIVNNALGTSLTYFWDFGDGNTSNFQNPSHSYVTAGPFYLCVTVDDGNGCTDIYCDSIGENGVVFNKSSGGFDINVVTPITTRIDNNINLNSELNIYPNPASDRLTIDTELAINEINIIDMTGKMMIATKQNTKSVNVTDLSTGIYFLKIITEEQTITKKFIKE